MDKISEHWERSLSKMIWGIIMEKLKVKYTPPVVIAAAVIIFAAAVFTGSSIVEGTGAYIGSIVGFIIGLRVLLSETTVEFGEGNIIRCRCLFYSWKIDLDKTERISYSVDKHIMGGSTRYSLNLRFYKEASSINDNYVLRKMIDHSDITKLMSGDMSRIDLMRIYKYVQSVCPEKAKGYVQDSGFFE